MRVDWDLPDTSSVAGSMVLDVNTKKAQSVKTEPMRTLCRSYVGLAYGWVEYPASGDRPLVPDDVTLRVFIDSYIEDGLE